MGCLLSIGAHLYLTLHYYPLKFGFASGQSLCNLNAKFDCDAVSASAYSALLGIPLAAWGMVFNAILFMMILMSWLEWTDHPERLRRWTLLLSGTSFAASLVMGTISLVFMSNYCLFCIALYVLSAIIFIALLGILREPFWSNLKHDIPNLWSESRGIIFSFAAIPLMAFLTHKIFTQNLGEGEVSKIVNQAVVEWEVAPQVNFVAKPSLTKGPSADEAAVTLVEFADFRCGHCKRASFTLDAFVNSHPDVRFEFYSFPLDGACNEKINQASGLSCRLAATVYCAEKDGKGWEMHDRIFEKQEVINGYGTTQELDKLLANEVTAAGLNWDSLLRCVNEPETTDAIKAQAKQGALANVMGTPTLFAEGRIVSRGHMIPVLQGIREKAKARKSPK